MSSTDHKTYLMARALCLAENMSVAAFFLAHRVPHTTRFANGSKLNCLNESDVDYMRGANYDYVVADEMALSAETEESVVEPSLIERNGALVRP